MTTPYRLIFLDLDGTLVGRDEIVSPRTLAALDRAQQRGCTVVICTARSRIATQPVAAQWDGHGYAIFCNGAFITQWRTGRVLQKTSLDPETAREAARLAHVLGSAPIFTGVHTGEDGGRTLYTDRVCPLLLTFLARHGTSLIFHDDLGDAPDLCPLGVGAYGPAEAVHGLTRAWEQALGPRVVAFASPAERDGCWCTYINAQGATKAAAAERVAAMLGVPQEQTLVVGDHLNDLELLEWAGLGVCMGDGHADVRGRADHVTGTRAEDGAAQAIERFVLGA